MNFIKNTLLGIIAVFATITMFDVAMVGTSAMHQIYGGTTMIVVTLCVGLWGGGK